MLKSVISTFSSIQAASTSLQALPKDKQSTSSDYGGQNESTWGSTAGDGGGGAHLLVYWHLCSTAIKVDWPAEVDWDSEQR